MDEYKIMGMTGSVLEFPVKYPSGVIPIWPKLYPLITLWDGLRGDYHARRTRFHIAGEPSFNDQIVLPIRGVSSVFQREPADIMYWKEYLQTSYFLTDFKNGKSRFTAKEHIFRLKDETGTHEDDVVEWSIWAHNNDGTTGPKLTDLSLDECFTAYPATCPLTQPMTSLGSDGISAKKKGHIEQEITLSTKKGSWMNGDQRNSLHLKFLLGGDNYFWRMYHRIDLPSGDYHLTIDEFLHPRHPDVITKETIFITRGISLAQVVAAYNEHRKKSDSTGSPSDSIPIGNNIQNPKVVDDAMDIDSPSES
ncbi:MAG: hypothetical protein M1834_004347 [Cirrosporium novae-zelandiae]|nr:MAG: hypothetical protein M1834_004347 [Cirrosporium novae-zelandiae]